MKILATADVRRLETLLVHQLLERADGGLREPVLLLVPTSRLVAHIKARILQKRSAVLGVHVYTHFGLCQHALESALQVPPQVLPTAAHLQLLNQALAGLPRDERAYFQAHAGARRSLLRTLQELREAGISATEFSAAARTEAEKQLVPLYDFMEQRLEQLATQGWADFPGLAREALPATVEFIRRRGIQRIFHYGAYELIGVNLDLVEALDRVAPCEFLVPAGVSSPVYRYPQRFVDLVCRRTTAEWKAVPRGPGSRSEGWIHRLTSLYPESTGQTPSVDDEVDPLPIELRSVQGARAELEAAGLRALQLHISEGIPWHEIAIVARSLESYTPHLAQMFAHLGVPFTTSGSLPLRRDPLVRAFLQLLKLYVSDFERSALIELLRSAICRFSGANLEPTDCDRWDRWSRRARIVSGLDSWRELQQLLTERPLGVVATLSDQDLGAEESAQRSIARLLHLLDDMDGDLKRWQTARRFCEHFDVLCDIANHRLAPLATDGGRSEESPTTTPPLQRLLSVLPALHTMESSSDANSQRAAIQPVDVLQILEETAVDESLDLPGQTPGGVRVLDLMQARSLTHRVVQWIGFHDGLFPRRPRQDPYLSDESRRRLGAVTKRPLAVRSAAEDEEKTLLALTLSGATERVALSFQRADEDGKNRTRSSALREIAHAFLGRASAQALLDAPELLDHLPAHPGELLRFYANSPRYGLLPPCDAAVGAALIAGEPAAAAKELLDTLEQERAGQDAGFIATEAGGSTHRNHRALDWVTRVEGFSPGAYGGDVDCLTNRGLDAHWELSPTAFETLARCPQSFFLRYVLRIDELEEATEAHKIEMRVLGAAIHETLEKLYASLHAGGLLQHPFAETAAHAEGLLSRVWKKTLQRVAGPSFHRLRGLFALLGDRWLASLHTFVRSDLSHLMGSQERRLELERTYRAQLQLAKELTLPSRGRIDRLVSNDDGFVITDYKTSGHLASKVSLTNMLQGRNIQLPLYREIVAAALDVEPARVGTVVAGVGPVFDRVDKPTAQLKWSAEAREGFLETLRVVTELARAGRFPLQPATQSCSYCRYRRTCRKDHEPTLQRLAQNKDLQDFYDLATKTASAPRLTDVRQRREKAQPEDSQQKSGSPEGTAPAPRTT